MILKNNSALPKQEGPSHRETSRWGWALLLLVVCVAAALRFWQLGHWPPGLYRDEAFNGLDALGVLNGRHALFFPANNGREPSLIYLTAFFIRLFGPTVTAVRLGTAVVGTVTTLFVYLLAREWFGQRTGLFAAWLWAVTLWSVHLSHIGLRIVLLVPCLTLAFWLGTLAYRRQKWWLWLLAGLAYGLGFYTYLAVRFTPLLLGLVLVYLLWQRRTAWWPGIIWFMGGTAVILLPLALLFAQQSELFLGRSNQVSIFNEIINQGNFWGALGQNIARTLGMFIWRGDSILRHNPAGRPLFDPLMAVPFLIGLGWCVWQWRRPPAAITLLWIGVMLGVTILAEDAPHFLRAVGILPAILFLPAIGLNWLWEWERVPAIWRQLLVLGLLIGSLLITIRDYAAYNNDPETALLFEAAATDLAERLRQEDEDTAVYLDSWYWDEASQKGWPSIPFLADLQHVTFYRPEFGLPPPKPEQPVTIYAWPFGDLSFVPRLMPAPVLISIQEGSLARGDLEETAYPLFIRYHAQPLNPLPPWPETVNFGGQMLLRQAAYSLSDAQTAWIDLYWEVGTAVSSPLTAFVQIIGPEGVIAQNDLPPGGSYWQADWWEPGMVVHEQRRIELPRPYDPATQQIIVGLYDPATAVRLPVLDANGDTIGDSWPIEQTE